SSEQRERALARLRHILKLAGRTTELELVLRTELARGDLAAATRLALSRELGALLAERGHPEGALEVLADATQKLPFDKGLLTDVRDLANRTGDRTVLEELLSRMLTLAPDDEAKLVILRELAPLSKELGDHATARAHFDAITRLDPSDRDAIEALERDASERADHEAVALLLARRVASSTSPEARKTVRLRRAAVLEQRLGRLADACAELES